MNHVLNGAGAVHLYRSNITMHESTLHGNSAVNFGGTMTIDRSTVNISRRLFTRSDSTNHGVIGIYRSTATIQYSNFTDCHAVHAGGWSI